MIIYFANYLALAQLRDVMFVTAHFVISMPQHFGCCFTPAPDITKLMMLDKYVNEFKPHWATIKKKTVNLYDNEFVVQPFSSQKMEGKSFINF